MAHAQFAEGLHFSAFHSPGSLFPFPVTLTSATYNGIEGDTNFEGVCVQADEAGGGTTLGVDFDVTLVATPGTASESFL